MSGKEKGWIIGKILLEVVSKPPVRPNPGVGPYGPTDGPILKICPIFLRLAHHPRLDLLPD